MPVPQDFQLCVISLAQSPWSLLVESASVFDHVVELTFSTDASAAEQFHIEVFEQSAFLALSFKLLEVSLAGLKVQVFALDLLDQV